jgi:hypothetical protein
LAAGPYISKLQRLQNKFLRNTGNFPSRTPTRDSRVGFQNSVLVWFRCQLPQAASRTRAKSLQFNSGQGEAIHRNIRGLNLAAVRLTTIQVTKLQF